MDLTGTAPNTKDQVNAIALVDLHYRLALILKMNHTLNM